MKNRHTHMILKLALVGLCVHAYNSCKNTIANGNVIDEFGLTY